MLKLNALQTAHSTFPPPCSHNGKKTTSVTIPISSHYRVWWLQHLSVRKIIKRRHAHLAAPIKVMTLLSAWRSHLRFLSPPHFAFIPADKHTYTCAHKWRRKTTTRTTFRIHPCNVTPAVALIVAGVSEQVDLGPCFFREAFSPHIKSPRQTKPHSLSCCPLKLKRPDS